MRKLLFLSLLVLSVTSVAQQRRLQLALQLQPGLTFHKGEYPGEPELDARTFNMGLGANVQYDIRDRWFANAGGGFISRRIDAKAGFNQVALPPNGQGVTFEYVTLRSVTYHIAYAAVNAGYHFIRRPQFRSFVTAGLSANYLLSGNYQTNSSRYNGTYRKNYVLVSR